MRAGALARAHACVCVRTRACVLVRVRACVVALRAGRGQEPVVFRRLNVGEEMSFVEATDVSRSPPIATHTPITKIRLP